jgi:uncharacterized protein (TIGR02646 family)
LDPQTRAYLTRKARKAKAFQPNDPRIERAWSNLVARERRRKDEARERVGTALDRYTSGKCAYCEQIASKTIEHFYPKSLCPSRMFAWSNFLRGCHNCNNAKLGRFPTDAAGRRLLLSPCADEPMDYFVWDTLTGATGLTTDLLRRPRAQATRDLFQLDQEPLREERRNKIIDVLYLLARVYHEEPVSSQTRDRLHDHLQAHRPWLGPIRQLFLRSQEPIKTLVQTAQAKLPEIDDWIEPWI